MTLDQYIANLNQRYKLGNATEHTFRGDLQQLIESLIPDIQATNEPKRQKCGAPDYILTRKDIPVGFIEAKDIGDSDLSGTKKTGHKEQFDRYKASLNNLIFTDYLDFHLYRDGQFVTKIAIGEVTTPAFGHPSKGGEIKPLPENFAQFENLIRNFCTTIGQTIKSSKKLSEMMAGKARLLANVIEKALASDTDNNEDSTLKDQMNAFKEILIHDITPKSFADVYAQTIAYGMFAARYHDPTLPTFNRQEAYELIPKSNPFLKKLFGYIAGLDVDDRIKWIVDDLINIFLACNVEELLKDYGKGTKMEDPIIHFYEDFLSEYDPALRKARGVWYTPQPVVNFIVRAVDDILKTEFDLPQGLADTSKTTIKVDMQGKKVPQEVHRVQILDPATGTGTFLAEVVKLVHKKFEGQQGIWSNYVETHLLPRLNGFELLMASYAMAHLKLDLLLTETGYRPTFPSSGGVAAGRGGRLQVYLTNSLEQYHPDTGTLWANWLSTEANEANRIKRDTPVMVVMGNPPYSVSSSNKSEWIEKLTADYKKDLKEQNINSLSDDYIKFIRFGQHFVDKNGSGILAYISNNSFIDGIIHRQMRKHLLESFDKIYILDLHGNSKKKEVCPDGTPDQNVFDIMQGVSINLFVKTGKKKKNELAQVLHFDLFGKREFKYDYLQGNSLKSFVWNELKPEAPNFFLVKKDFEGSNEYEKGFKIDELFYTKGSGIKFRKDNLLVKNHFCEGDVKTMISDINKLSKHELLKTYNFEETEDWKVDEKRALFVETDYESIVPINYRPFDFRYTYYPVDRIGEIIPRGDSRRNLMRNIIMGSLGFICFRQSRNMGIGNFWITKCAISKDIISSLDSATVFPLYVYPETSAQQTIGQTTERTPNLNAEIVNQIAENLGLTFVPEKPFPSTGGVAEGRGGPFPPPQDGVVHSTVEILTHINHKPIFRRFIQNLPYNPALKPLLKDKRKAGILSEVLFWQQVHKGEFHNIDFDRQRIIGNYIVDFYVKTLGLVIEIDGSSHDDKVEYDKQRQDYLESLGLKVYRIDDFDVKENLEWVMTALEKYIVEEFGESTTPSCAKEQTTPVGAEERTTPAYGHPTPPAPSEKGKGGEWGGEFAPIDILDYIYAVLHSPSYREKYKEFLKIDFPRVPYPKAPSPLERAGGEAFWQLVKLGGELRQIHLLESPVVEKYITQYPEDGNNVVDKIKAEPSVLEMAPEASVNYANGSFKTSERDASYYQKMKVYINDTQYFDNVPELAWNFYIGGYQPAQKWLKDRKGRTLDFEDILHYQKIIVALCETDRIMKEIDGIKIE